MYKVVCDQLRCAPIKAARIKVSQRYKKKKKIIVSKEIKITSPEIWNEMYSDF